MFESMKEAVLAVPAWNWGLQAVGVAFAYLGAEMNARLRIEGFFLWMISNVALAMLHAATSLWLLLLLDLLFFRVNLIGIKKWSRTHPESVPGWMSVVAARLR